MIEGLSSWIMSIAGVICLSVIVELVLPDGQMNRYIKGTFSFIIILVIIMPVPKLLGQQLNTSDILNYEEITIDDDYIYQLNLDKINSLQANIEEDILKRGYENVRVYISCDIFGNSLSFESITVDINNLVITDNAEHNNITKIKQDITSLIQGYVDIEEEAILYDG